MKNLIKISSLLCLTLFMSFSEGKKSLGKLEIKFYIDQ